MSPRAFLPAFFLISLAAAGQTVSSAPGLIVNGGYVAGPVGNGQVEASSVTFASPAPTAGASISGIAGISDHAPLQQGATTSPASTVVYSTASPTVYSTNQGGANVTATQETAPQASVADLTPTFYAGSNAAGTPANGASSLGEVSALNKARNGAQRARTYTNADVQRLISHEGAGNIMEATIRPSAGIAASGQNPQSSSNTASPQNTIGSANATSAQNTAPTPQPNPSQDTTSSQQSATGPRPESQPGATSAETSAANQSAASNETRQNAGTTPQISHPQQTETEQDTQQLPATSTMLPLLGLLGITASGIGLWFRRFRK